MDRLITSADCTFDTSMMALSAGIWQNVFPGKKRQIDQVVIPHIFLRIICRNDQYRDIMLVVLLFIIRIVVVA